jgi:hypothetical protein
MRDRSANAYALRVLRLLRLVAVLAIVIDLVVPVHVAAMLATPSRAHLVAVATTTQSTNDASDDDCPGDCAACPCLHLQCVPPQAMRATLQTVPVADLPPYVIAVRHVPRAPVYRLERPPRA